MENKFWLVKPTHLNRRYPPLLTKINLFPTQLPSTTSSLSYKRFNFNSTIVNYVLSQHSLYQPCLCSESFTTYCLKCIFFFWAKQQSYEICRTVAWSRTITSAGNIVWKISGSKGHPNLSQTHGGSDAQRFQRI